MKKFNFLLVILAFASFVFAETKPPTKPPATTPPQAALDKPLPETLSWMVGQWEGQGVARDQQFLAKMTITSELDDTILSVTRESTSKNNTISGGLKEMMLIGLDGTTKKIVQTLYDNKNRIALYVGELQPNQVVFSLATSQPGYVDRRIYRQLPDGGLSFVIEGATPGKVVSKQVEINFKKKS